MADAGGVLAVDPQRGRAPAGDDNRDGYAAMSESITLVVERHAGREYAMLLRGPLTGRLAEKGARPVYMLRIDRLGAPERDFWLSKGCAELLAVWRWLRDEGTLPPPNLADPPRKA